MAPEHAARQLRAIAVCRCWPGLLGNIGYKLETEGAGSGGEYLGARGIKFYPHPGAHLV